MAAPARVYCVAPSGRIHPVRRTALEDRRLSRLYLLRHAKAGWAAPGMRDYNRPLDTKGHADAEAIGLAMRDAGHVPDLTLCSGAKRARETLAGVATHADTGRVAFVEELYSTDAAGYLSLIKQTANADALLVIGHNPMMEDLAQLLAGDGDEKALAILASGFPTSGLAVIDANGSLRELSPETSRLVAFLTPADS